VETKVIQSFPFEELFNFKKEADSMLGYEHTAEAIEKMKLRFVDKTNKRNPTPVYIFANRKGFLSILHLLSLFLTITGFGF
jgi:hypothetical protein